MTTKRLQRPRDPIQLGKLMVDIATGQVVDALENGKDQAAFRQRWLVSAEPLPSRSAMVHGLER
jgi:hypothetical protein